MFKPVIAAAKKLFGIQSREEKRIASVSNKMRDVAKSSREVGDQVAKATESVKRLGDLFGKSRKRGARFLRRGFSARPAAFLSGAQVAKSEKAAHGMRVFLAKQQQRFLVNGNSNQFRSYMGQGQ